MFSWVSVIDMTSPKSSSLWLTPADTCRSQGSSMLFSTWSCSDSPSRASSGSRRRFGAAVSALFRLQAQSEGSWAHSEQEYSQGRSLSYSAACYARLSCSMTACSFEPGSALSELLSPVPSRTQSRRASGWLRSSWPWETSRELAPTSASELLLPRWALPRGLGTPLKH